MAWAEDYRQNWIAETLRVFGFINRAHLERKFGISTPQASLDLQKFMADNPGAMTYNKTTKQYEATSGEMSYAVGRAMKKFSERLRDVRAATK
jgi:hypothetical protein